MKFSCDRCQTRYSIGDEKVRGKVLKIRCKTCGNILVVREPGAVTDSQAGAVQPIAAGAAHSSQAAGATQGVAGPAAAPQQPRQAPHKQPAPQPHAREEVDWYVAIKGKQHGPAKRDDVVRLYRDAKITERTYLWNETMANWTRLREVPTFQFLLSEPAPEQKPKRPPPPPPSDEAQAGAEIIPFDEAKRARAVSADSATGIPHHDPFAAVSQQSGGLAGLGTGGNPLEAAPPRDSTRVFIMQAGLQDRAVKQRRYAYGAAAGVGTLVVAMLLDYNDVIAIPGLHSVVNVVAHKEREDYKPPDQLAWDSGDQDPVLACKLMPDREQCEKKVKAQNVERRRKKAAAAAINNNTGGAVDLNGAFNTGGDTGAGGVSRAGIGEAASGGGLAAGLSTSEKEKLALLSHDDKQATMVKLHDPAADKQQLEGQDLDPENVAAVVKQNQPAIQDCIEKAAKTGDVLRGKKYLVVSVEPNGRVSNAKFKDGPTAASEGGECIARAAKKWKFAPFPGPPTDAEIPLILSLN